eukprot:TRINITY_DN4763_c0_g1_i4.p1 TRINITY_DN4763_c0_g1~~TRINITY_DN4763_c0_g1_i4.p1  ORF type:complete len:4247 (+),score=977.42 TRINITY_DN4763_c0_g1_i4:998-12742(+)
MEIDLPKQSSRQPSARQPGPPTDTFQKPPEESTVEVRIPFGVRPGDVFFADVNGQQVEVTVPGGAKPGQSIRVEAPAKASPAARSSPLGNRGNEPSLMSRMAPAPEPAKRIEMVPVEIPVPDMCRPGDTFYAQVDGEEYAVTVPAGSRPGATITLEVPRQASTGSTPAEVEETVDVTVPAGVQPGTTFHAQVDGRDFSVQVPLGVKPGSVISVELLKKPLKKIEEEHPLHEDVPPMLQEDLRQLAPVQKRGVTHLASTKAAVKPKPKPKVKQITPRAAEQAALPASGLTTAGYSNNLEAAPRGLEAAPGRGPPTPTLQPSQDMEARSRSRSFAESTGAESQLSQVSLVEITIPEKCWPGDRFTIEVDGMEYEVMVPPGCGPGDVISMDVLPEGATLSEHAPSVASGSWMGSRTASKVEEVRESARGSRPASSTAARSRPQSGPQGNAAAGGGFFNRLQPPQPAESSIAESIASDRELIHIQVPEGVHAGETFYADFNGLEFEVLVPSKCRAGDTIALEVPSTKGIERFQTTQQLSPHSASPPSQHSSPMSATPQKAPPETAEVEIPEGFHGGDELTLDIEGYGKLTIIVPDGCRSGDTIDVEIPSRKATPRKATPKIATSTAEISIQTSARLAETLVPRPDPPVMQASAPIGRAQEAPAAKQQQRQQGATQSIPVIVPEGCYPGSSFFAEVDGREFEMQVPEDAYPGEEVIIELPMDMADLSSEASRASSRRLSQTVEPTQASARKLEPSAAELRKAVHDAFGSQQQKGTPKTATVAVPEGCLPGSIFFAEVGGKEFELTVPDDAEVGDEVLIELPEDFEELLDSGPPSSRKQAESLDPQPASARKLETTMTPSEVVRTEHSPAGGALEDDQQSSSLAVAETPNIIEITIPDDCGPGDGFCVEVDGAEFELMVPEGCRPGETIYMDVMLDGLLGNYRLDSEVSDSERASSRPASAGRRIEGAPGGIVSDSERASYSGGIEESSGERDIIEVVIPDGHSPGDVFSVDANGVQFEIIVPEGCEPGETIFMDVLPDYRLSKSARSSSNPTKTTPRQVESKISRISDSEHIVEITVPHNARVKDVFYAEVNGMHFEVEVPPGSAPGDVITMALPPEYGSKSSKGSDIIGGTLIRYGDDSASMPAWAAGADSMVIDLHFKLEGNLQSFDDAAFLDALAGTLEVDQSILKVRLSPGSVIADITLVTTDPKVVRRAKRVVDMDLQSLAEALGSEVLEAPSLVVSAAPNSAGAPLKSARKMACVELTIPEDCYPGNTFFAEVKGVEFELIVPDGCRPGDVIEMEVPEAVKDSKDTVTASDLPSSRRHSTSSNPRPASAKKKLPDAKTVEMVDLTIPDGYYPGETFRAEVDGMGFDVIVPSDCAPGDEVEIEIPLAAMRERQMAKRAQPVLSSRKAMTTVEIVIPEGCHPGSRFYAEVDGREFEVTVPEDTEPGDEIIMDVPVDFAAGGNISGLPSSRSSVRRHPATPNPRPTSSRKKTQTVEIPIPAGCFTGSYFFAEVDGREFKVTVPEGAQPGDDIIMDLPHDFGTRVLATPPSSRRHKETAYPEPASARLKMQTVEVTIPQGCFAGASFFAMVNNQEEVEVPVPEGCSPGDVIEIELPPPKKAPPKLLPRSALTTTAFEEPQQPEVPVPHSSPWRGKPGRSNAAPSKSNSEPEGSSKSSILEIAVPAGFAPGDVFMADYKGLQFEVVVPDGCGSGDIVSIQLPSGELSTDVTPRLLATPRAKKSVEVTIPAGFKPGDTFRAEVNGIEFEAEVPPGCVPGDVILTELPAASRESSIPPPSMEVTVPQGYHAGDDFLVVADGMEFEVKVPDDCGPGSVVTFEIPPGTPKGVRSKVRASSAGRNRKDEPRIPSSGELMEVTIPEGLQTGDSFVVEMHGREFEVVVPDNALPGTVIGLEVPRSSRSEESSKATAMASSSKESFVQVTVPLDVQPGEEFIASISGEDFKVLAPLDSKPGDVIDLLVPLKSKDAGRTASTISSRWSSGDLEVAIPEGCMVGDEFVAEVNGVDFAVTVPDGCKEGDRIAVKMPTEEGFLARAGSSLPVLLSETSKSGDPRKHATAREIRAASGDRAALVEVVVPEGVRPGDEFVAEVNGLEVLVVVPAESRPGTALEIEVNPGSMTARSVTRSQVSLDSARAWSKAVIEVTIPEGCKTGDEFLVEAEDLEFKVLVPEGFSAGMMLPVEIPTAPPSEYSGDVEDTGSSVVQVVVPDECKPGDDFIAETAGGIQFKVATPDNSTGGSVLTVRVPRSELKSSRQKSSSSSRSTRQRPLTPAEWPAGSDASTFKEEREEVPPDMRLRVRILGARGLELPEGTSEYFAVCRLDSSVALRTKLAKDLNNPVWNYEEEIDYPPGTPLDFSVMALQSGEEPVEVGSCTVRAKDFATGLERSFPLAGIGCSSKASLKLAIQAPVPKRPAMVTEARAVAPAPPIVPPLVHANKVSGNAAAQEELPPLALESLATLPAKKKEQVPQIMPRKKLRPGQTSSDTGEDEELRQKRSALKNEIAELEARKAEMEQATMSRGTVESSEEAPPAPGEEVHELIFKDLSLKHIDQKAFKEELRRKLCDSGMSPAEARQLKMRLREGSVIVELYGPVAAVSVARSIPAKNLLVMGCVAEVLPKRQEESKIKERQREQERREEKQREQERCEQEARERADRAQQEEHAKEKVLQEQKSAEREARRKNLREAQEKQQRELEAKDAEELSALEKELQEAGAKEASEREAREKQLKSQSRSQKQADADAPTSVEIEIPEGVIEGEQVTVDIEGYGELTITVPEGCMPGDMVDIDLPKKGPKAPESVEVEIPEGFEPGDELTIDVDGYGELTISIPQGCRPGDTIDVDVPKTTPRSPQAPESVEVEIPEGFEPGDELTVEVDGYGELTITVPQGCRPGETLEIDVPKKEEASPKATPRSAQATARELEQLAQQAKESAARAEEARQRLRQAQEERRREAREREAQEQAALEKELQEGQEMEDLQREARAKLLQQRGESERERLEMEAQAEARAAEEREAARIAAEEEAEREAQEQLSLAEDTAKKEEPEAPGPAPGTPASASAKAPAPAPAKTPTSPSKAPASASGKDKGGSSKRKALGPFRIRVSFLSATCRSSSEKGASETYCVGKILSRGISFQTPVVADSSNPVWNSEHEVPEVAPGDVLELELHEQDASGATQLLGSAQIPSGQFFPDGLQEELSLKDGSLKVKIENLGLSSEFAETLKTLEDAGPRRLRVSVLSAKEIKNSKAGNITDPFCVCRVLPSEAAAFQTPIVGESTSPNWGYVHDIPEIGTQGPLEFAVYGHDKANEQVLLGTAQVNSSRFLTEKAFEQDLILTGSGAQGCLKVKVQSLGSSAAYLAEREKLVKAGPNRIRVVVIEARGISRALGRPFCICRIGDKEEPEFKTKDVTDKRNPQWRHESLVEAYVAGDKLEFEVCEQEGANTVSLGCVELSSDHFFPSGLTQELRLTGQGVRGSLKVEVKNLGTQAEHEAALAAQKAAEEAAAEAVRLQAIEKAREEEEEREKAKIAAKKAAEEAERRRIAELRRQAQEEAERKIREEEARIAREEAERLGRRVVSLSVVDDLTEEVMANISLRLSSTVAEVGQVVVRDSKLSVLPVLYKEKRQETKEVPLAKSWMQKSKEPKERTPLSPEDTLLEAGIEDNAVLRAKISSAVITASKDCTARVWNAETGRCELLLEGHTDAVCAACISPDCRYVATSSEDATARIWAVDTGKCARQLLGHKEAVYSTAFSPDSKQVVTASQDGTAKIWVVKTGLCRLTLKGHGTAVLWASFSPDGKSVTTTACDGTLKIWNGKTGICDRTLLGQKPVYLASFASDGRAFVSACGDDTAKICDIVTGECLRELKGHTGLVLSASFAPSQPSALRDQFAETQEGLRKTDSFQTDKMSRTM